MSIDERNSASGFSRRRVLAAAAAGAAAPAITAAGPAVAHSGTPHRPARKVGFVLSHEQFRTPQLVDFARHAERAGFDRVWASDHTQPWQDNQGHSMFPWLTLSQVAETTRALTFGTGVTCPLYRYHPTQVAQAFASLGILAPGRVFLGVGTGEALNELASTGQFGRYPERHDRLAEAIDLIREVWTGRRVSFRGTYYRTEQYKLYDRPARPVPIYVAASGPKSAYLAGQRGDGWITGAADFAKPQLQDAFAAGAAAAGKDPRTMPKLVETFVVVGGKAEAEYAARRWRFTVDAFGDLLYVPNPVTIQQRAEQRWSLPQVYANWPRGTDPDVHTAALQKIIDAGGTPMVHSGQADQHRVIDFYGEHVLPRLRFRHR
ncbi:F420-dependent hydroxymycolic acid dehydrogenase [Actinoplanes sp. M2I2]|uniref:F420-dependent hydroxymycolic acid dehydrogenase n=1 Tax=Actinoplanes sp. M2I2 TaxID=1734444 RepID=UPI0020202787|nr:F420-dependent hydroxymycolic acid dehydrogenase [Actinoplanes sp. M2I2]